MHKNCRCTGGQGNKAKADGLTIKEANLRINAGKTDEFYKKNADYIIYNNGDEEAFLKKFTEIMKEITGGNL